MYLEYNAYVEELALELHVLLKRAFYNLNSSEVFLICRNLETLSLQCLLDLDISFQQSATGISRKFSIGYISAAFF